MTNRAKYIKRQIRELQRQLADEMTECRKQYWRDRYASDREKYKAAANARNAAKRENSVANVETK